jgi:diacylglycerol kinase
VFITSTQPNWRIHAIATLLAVGAGLAAGLSFVEWALLLLAVGLVMGAEALNTALEATVDSLPGGYSEGKRHAKDAAAAGVLVVAMGAAGVGLLLFGPRILGLVGR